MANKYQGDSHFESYSNQGQKETRGSSSRNPKGYIGDSNEGTATSPGGSPAKPKGGSSGEQEGWDSKDKGQYIGTSGQDKTTTEMDSNRSHRAGHPSEGSNSKMRGGYIGSSG